MSVKVNFTKFKKSVNAALQCHKFEKLERYGDYVMLTVGKHGMRIGAKFGPGDFMTRIPLQAPSKMRKTVFISSDDARVLTGLTKPKDDIIELSFEDTELLYKTMKIGGNLKYVPGMRVKQPNLDLEGRYLFTIPSMREFGRALSLAALAKKGWAAHEQTFIMGHVRLMYHAISAVFDKQLGCKSASALTTLATDGARYFQVAMPGVICAETSVALLDDLVQLVDETYHNVPLFMERGIAEVVGKVLTLDEPAYVYIVPDPEHPTLNKRLVIANGSFLLRIRVVPDGAELADILSTFASEKDAATIDQLFGMLVATTSTVVDAKRFAEAVGAVSKLKLTKQHGLTLALADGEVMIASPEIGGQKRQTAYIPVDGWNGVEAYVIVNGQGLTDAIKLMSGSTVTLVFGDGYVTILGESEHITLFQFSSE